MEISSTSGRHFSGVVGLKPGYSSDLPAFSREDILKSWNEWVRARHFAGDPFLGIIVSQVEDILYAFEKDGELLQFAEPVVRVYGEIPSYQEDIDDDGIRSILLSMFVHFGRLTQQTTVRFTLFGNEIPRISYRIRMPDTSHPLD